ncbi:unnamed protein product [Rotaria sordida]|uniref:Uncharacterized protein n=1 Tax=Rotaria sordida TaxID=392033 RepID=A0A815DG16_9BILA|nr:unnamed protein product [Rotaria sordida]CAF1571066.1 unnamed protein product [Rotaria sordida]
MHTKSTSNTSYRSVPTNVSFPSKKCSISLLSGIIITLLTSIIIVLCFLYTIERSKTRINAKDTCDLCLTPDCIKAASSLYESVDETIDPCENFYEFTCGKWIKNAKISAEKDAQSIHLQMTTRLENALVDLLSSTPSNGTIESKAITNARHWYNACVNRNANKTEDILTIFSFIQKELGGLPLIEGLAWNESTFDFYRLMFKLNQYNSFKLYTVKTIIDYKNSSLRSILIYPTSPLIDMHLLTIEGMKIIELSSVVLSNSLQATDDDASHQDVDLVDLQKFASKISEYKNISNLSLNDTIRTTVSNLSHAINISSDFTDYVRRLYLFGNVSLIDTDVVTVVAPDIIRDSLSFIGSQSPRTVQNYLILHFITNENSIMHKRFRSIGQSYRNRSQEISDEQLHRVGCAKYLSTTMSSVVSQIYVQKYFNKDARKEARKMFRNIRNVFIHMINQSTWMDSESKIMTIKKIQAMKGKIGYPDYFENDDMMKLKKEYEYNFNSSFTFNGLHLNQLHSKTHFQSLHDPIDKNEWLHILPTTMNGHYYILLNDIIIPAAFLQIPHFDNNLPKYLSYGGAGFIIGHEIAHSLDDNSRDHGMYENEFSLWTNETIEALNERMKCVVNQYNNYTFTQVNRQLEGERTQNENLADIIGLKQAFFAYKKWTKSQKNVDKKLPGLTKYSNEQMFFINFGYTWCKIMSDEVANIYLTHDTHSPSEFRVIGSTSNFIEFDQAFGCKPGQGNSRMNKCYFW